MQALLKLRIFSSRSRIYVNRRRRHARYISSQLQANGELNGTTMVGMQTLSNMVLGDRTSEIPTSGLVSEGDGKRRTGRDIQHGAMAGINFNKHTLRTKHLRRALLPRSGPRHEHEYEAVDEIEGLCVWCKLLCARRMWFQR